MELKSDIIVIWKYSELNVYKDTRHTKVLEDSVQGDSGKLIAFNTDADYAADTLDDTIRYQWRTVALCIQRSQPC